MYIKLRLSFIISLKQLFGTKESCQEALS